MKKQACYNRLKNIANVPGNRSPIWLEPDTGRAEGSIKAFGVAMPILTFRGLDLRGNYSPEALK